MIYHSPPYAHINTLTTTHSSPPLHQPPTSIHMHTSIPLTTTHTYSPPYIHMHTLTTTPIHMHTSIPLTTTHSSPPHQPPTTRTYSQGLSDCEETVVCKTIEAMTTLCREQVFDKPTLLEYVSGLAPFLVHPVSAAVV